MLLLVRDRLLADILLMARILPIDPDILHNTYRVQVPAPKNIEGFTSSAHGLLNLSCLDAKSRNMVLHGYFILNLWLIHEYSKS